MIHWQMILTASVFKLDCNKQCLSSATPSLEVVRIFKSTVPIQLENTNNVDPLVRGKSLNRLCQCALQPVLECPPQLIMITRIAFITTAHHDYQL